MPPIPPDPLPAEEIFQHEKPGIRHYLILKTLPTLPAQVPLRPYIAEMDRILNHLYRIQHQAAELETEGQIDQAAKLYQQVIEAQLDDPHSYLRLCKIYQALQKPHQIRQVCQAYLQMVSRLNELGYHQPYRDELAETFRELMQETPP